MYKQGLIKIFNVYIPPAISIVSATLRWKKNTNCLNCINYHQVFMVNARLQSTNFQQRESRLIAGKSLQN